MRWPSFSGNVGKSQVHRFPIIPRQTLWPTWPRGPSRWKLENMRYWISWHVLLLAPIQKYNFFLSKTKSDLEKHFFCDLWTLQVQVCRRKSKLRQNSVNRIFNPNALFFSLLRYLNAIYILFTYFASCIGYENDILEDISNLHIQGAKHGGKRTNLAVELRGVCEDLFFQGWTKHFNSSIIMTLKKCTTK